MFSRYFQLRDNPFGETPNLRYFFRSQTHYEALIQFFRLLHSGKSLFLVVGEVGTGKTFLCRLIYRMLKEHRFRTALIFQPIFNSEDLLQQISEEFGLAPPEGSGALSFKEEFLRLQNHFIESAKAGRRCIIMIDEAHKLSFQALETLRLLTNLETDSEKLVSVVLFAQPELEQKLKAYHARQIRQRLAVCANLKPLSPIETESYIGHRMELAGAENFVRFDSRATRWIHKQSRGIPRLINFYAELSLLAAESRQIRLIKEDLVAEAVRQATGKKSTSSFFWSFFGGRGSSR